VRRYQGVPAEISTEYGSRSNVSNRMASRRFTRLTTCGVVVVVAWYVMRVPDLHRFATLR
jgi:hypothetical protein